MYKLTEIKEQIKKKPICYVYKISSPTDFKLVFKTDGKNESKQKIKEKYGNKQLNETDYFIIVKITFHTGTKFYQGGPIAANFDAYTFINKKLINIKKTDIKNFMLIQKNIIGIVWFDKTFIEKKGWTNNYLDNIIQKLIKGKTKLDIRTVYHINIL